MSDRPPAWGEPARGMCGATGRYIGHHQGFHRVLIVSAQDNVLFIDLWDQNPCHPPAGHLPLPTDAETAAAPNPRLRRLV